MASSLVLTSVCATTGLTVEQTGQYMSVAVGVTCIQVLQLKHCTRRAVPDVMAAMVRSCPCNATRCPPPISTVRDVVALAEDSLFVLVKGTKG